MSPQGTILRTLARRSFRANRGRNIVAILAIILTTMMFTSLFVIAQSMVANLQQMNIQQAGYASHLSSGLLTDEEASAIASHEDVRSASESTVVGVVQGVSGRQVEMRSASADYADSALALPTEGHIPEQADEIALDKITLDKLGLSDRIGDTVTLRWVEDLASGETKEASFTLCGTWPGNPAAMASMVWVSDAFAEAECAGLDQASVRADGGFLGLRMLHIDLFDDSDLAASAARILADTDLAESVTLSANFAYDASASQNVIRELLPMAVGMLLVFVSGYLIIYNIFQISVAADIRFYGRLKTLGATRRQLRTIVYAQARRLSLIGIPLGLVVGWLLGAVLVPLVITASGSQAQAVVDPWIFLGAALFAAVTVRLSCMRPARTCARVSPMEALRYTDVTPSRKRKEKRGTHAGLAAMAWANLGRNRRRTVLVIASLTLGLVLLSGVYAKNASFDIDKYMSQTVSSDFEVEDASISSMFTHYDPHGTTISADLLDRIDALDGLADTGALYSQVIRHPVDGSALKNIERYYNAEERLAVIEATDPGLYEAYNAMRESGECTAILYGIDGLVVDAFAEPQNLIAGSFDPETFARGGYVVVEAASGTEPGDTETQPAYSVGDQVTLGGQRYEVMAIVRDITTVTEGLNSEEADFLSFYIPAGDFRMMYPDNTLRKYFFDVDAADQPAAEAMLADYQAEEDPALPYTSRSTLIDHYKTQTRANTVMGFAISFIIAFVGVLNFVNAMLTSIFSRRREFAMLQSIGMTRRQLRRMLIWEGLFISGITLAASYALSGVVVGVGVRAMVASDWTATFHFTLWPLAICTPVLLAFAVLIPLLCAHNIERQSIIERLRMTE